MMSIVSHKRCHERYVRIVCHDLGLVICTFFLVLVSTVCMLVVVVGYTIHSGIEGDCMDRENSCSLRERCWVCVKQGRLLVGWRVCVICQCQWAKQGELVYVVVGVCLVRAR